MKNLKKIAIIFCLLLGATACVNNRPKPIQTIKYEDEKFEKIEQKEIKEGIREVDISKKRLNKNKKAYVAGETELFTGIFSLRYAGHLLNFEEYKNGVLDGDKVWFGNDGTVGMREKYVNGKKNGDQITYHLNGNIRSIIPYKNGNINGTIEWYDPNGLLIDESVITNGTGRFVRYFENGNIEKEGYFKNYRKVGEWKTYNQNRVLEKIITYSNNGGVIKTRWYN